MTIVNLIKSKSYDSARLAKLTEALQLIQKVINSDAFRKKVLQYNFHFRRGVFGIGKDIYYTNEQIYAMIMNAVEDPGNVVDHSIDLYLELLDGSDGSVVGYGNPSGKEIYTYKVKFDELNTKEIANHIAHEWSHKLGFTHAGLTSFVGKRDNSVPYAIGNIVEELC